TIEEVSQGEEVIEDGDLPADVSEPAGTPVVEEQPVDEIVNNSTHKEITQENNSEVVEPSDELTTNQSQTTELEEKRQAVLTQLGQVKDLTDKEVFRERILQADSVEDLSELSSQIDAVAEANQAQKQESVTEETKEASAKDTDNSLRDIPNNTPEVPTKTTDNPSATGHETSTTPDEATLKLLSDLSDVLTIQQQDDIRAGKRTIEDALSESFLRQNALSQGANIHVENIQAAAGLKLGKHKDGTLYAVMNADLTQEELKLFQPFTTNNKVNDVFDRLKSLKDKNIISDMEYHMARWETYRRLRDSDTGVDLRKRHKNSPFAERHWRTINNESGRKLSSAERNFLNSNLRNENIVTLPSSTILRNKAGDVVANTELNAINDLMRQLEEVVKKRFETKKHTFLPSTNNSGTGSSFQQPGVTYNADGTVTVTTSVTKNADNGSGRQIGLGLNLSDALKERSTATGTYNGKSRETLTSTQEGYLTGDYETDYNKSSKGSRTADFTLTFRQNGTKIQEEGKLAAHVLYSAYEMQHEPGSYIETQEYNDIARRITEYLNLVTELESTKKKITETTRKINDFNQKIDAIDQDNYSREQH
ncbi:MAG: hypothetical protein AB1478_11240, partial [Nitrospirota bacterium]